MVSIHVLRRGRCVCSFGNSLDPFIAVSIHVLRRGRCVLLDAKVQSAKIVSIHVLRRGRCVRRIWFTLVLHCWFQSTSSEEDVVSGMRVTGRSCHELFQSTSSEEDVVSDEEIAFWDLVDDVSIHVLRRGRCVRYEP